jgi:hypothetical protein
MALPLPANQAPLDRYTLGHLAFGVMLGLARVPWWGALGTTLIFEYGLEDAMKKAVPRIFPVPTRDSPANRTLDSAAVMLGWLLMKRLPPMPPYRVVPQP